MSKIIMKPRIKKKLSKKLVQIAPLIFKEAWLDDEGLFNESGISNIWRVGGFPDYWGEATTVYTCWEWWYHYWPDFFYENISNQDDFLRNVKKIRAMRSKASTIKLLKMAREANQREELT